MKESPFYFLCMFWGIFSLVQGDCNHQLYSQCLKMRLCVLCVTAATVATARNYNIIINVKMSCGEALSSQETDSVMLVTQQYRSKVSQH